MRHPVAQGVASAGVQEAVAVEIQRFLRVVPAAVVAVAEQQVERAVGMSRRQDVADIRQPLLVVAYLTGIVQRAAGGETGDVRVNGADGHVEVGGAGRRLQGLVAGKFTAFGYRTEVVGEVVDVVPAAGRCEADGFQLPDEILPDPVCAQVGAVEFDVPGQGQPVFHPDAETVHGENGGIPVIDHARREVLGLLRRQRLAAQGRAGRTGRGDGGDDGQRPLVPVTGILRGRVDGVGLAGGRRPEPGTPGAPQRQGAGERQPGGQLAVGGCPEVLVILVAQRRAQGPVLQDIGFQVQVHGVIGTRPRAGSVRAETGEAVGGCRKALGLQVHHGAVAFECALPGGWLAALDLKLLFPPLQAEGDVQVRGQERQVDGIRQVQVHVLFPLHVPPGVEAEALRIRRPQRRIDRIADEERDIALPDTGAELRGEAEGRRGAQAGDQGVIPGPAAEAGREPAGEQLVHDEAVRVGQLECPGVEDAVPVEPSLGQQVARAVAGSGAGEVAHQAQAAARVHALPVVRVAEVEPAIRFLPGKVAESEHLQVFGQRQPRVEEGLDVVLDLRAAPDLGRVGHGAIAGCDERRRIVPLHAAAGVAGFTVFQAQVQKTVAQGQARVRRDGVTGAVSFGCLAIPGFEVHSLRVILEDKIHHPSNRIRAILGRGAIAQYFDALQGNGGDHRQVRPLRAFGRLGRQPCDHRAAVPALAVDQDQGMVGRQVAQVGRSHDGRAVGNRLHIDAECRRHRAQQVQHVGVAMVLQVLLINQLHRGVRFRQRPPGAP